MTSLRDSSRRRAAGGAARLFVSALLELVLSALYAPVMMLIQSRQVYEILRGHDAGWKPQRRSAAATVWWRGLWLPHWQHFGVGAMLALLLGYFSPILLAWLSPTVLGLLLAPWLSAASGSTTLGQALAAKGLLMIPEESDPVPLHRERDAAAQRYAALAVDLRPETLALRGDLRCRHFAAVMPAPVVRGRPDVSALTARAKLADAGDLEEAVQWLNPEEWMAVLSDATLFASMLALSVNRETEDVIDTAPGWIGNCA